MYTIKAARVAERVISVEPNPYAFAQLYENIRINDLKNVTLLRLAVRSYDGSTPLFIPTRDSILKTTIYKEHIREDVKPIVVPCRRLLTLLKHLKIPQIDILKIDIEGAELEVLSDKEAFSHCRIKSIVAEIHGKYNLAYALKMLKEYGYKSVKVFKPGQETYILYATGCIHE